MKTNEALDALSALSQPTRLAAFKLLVRAGPEGVPAGEIARDIGAPASTMSAHLSILAHAGLVAARRESRTIFYAIETKQVRALFDFLAADCCGGRPELCAPLTQTVCAPAKPKKEKVGA